MGGGFPDEISLSNRITQNACPRVICLTFAYATHGDDALG
jgi:hypothetical protein